MLSTVEEMLSIAPDQLYAGDKGLFETLEVEIKSGFGEVEIPP